MKAPQPHQRCARTLALFQKIDDCDYDAGEREKAGIKKDGAADKARRIKRRTRALENKEEKRVSG